MTPEPALPRADGLRFLRRVVFLLCLAVVALSLLLALAFVSITESRRDALRITCRQQNERHDETIRVLDERIAQLPDSQQVRAAQSRQYTVALIEALSPKFPDCDARAEQLVP